MFYCKVLFESVICDFICLESDLMKELILIIIFKDVVEWLCFIVCNCYWFDDLVFVNRIFELVCNFLKNVSCDILEGIRLKEMVFLICGVVYCSVSKY